MIASGVWWGGEKGVSGLESGLLIWVLCLLSVGVCGGQGGGRCLGVESTGRRLECLWGVVGSCWRVLKSAAGGIVVLLRRFFSYLLLVAV